MDCCRGFIPFDEKSFKDRIEYYLSQMTGDGATILSLELKRYTMTQKDFVFKIAQLPGIQVKFRGEIPQAEAIEEQRES